jgi:hypothetical protein
MSHFGHYLLKRVALRPAELEEALQTQVVCGGRLGTNILELGFLSLDELARLLADYTGVPLAPPRALTDPSAQAIKALPAELCRHFVALPFDVGADQIHVAMLDPRDRIQLARIAEVTRREVRAFAVPEVLLRTLLEQHVGLRLERRFARLAETLRERAAEPAAPEPAPRSDAHGSAGPSTSQDESPAPAPLAEGEELIDEDSFARLHEDLVLRAAESGVGTGAAADELVIEEPDGVESSPPPRAPVPAVDPGEVARLEARLETTADRDEIASLAVRIARGYARAAGLFLVHGDTVAGIPGADDEIGRRIQGVVIPLATKSTLAHVASTGGAFRGAPPGDGIDARVLAALGRSEARELLLLPIRIRGRVVNVLYADNGPDACGATSAAALTALCDAVTRAYERLILAAKRRESLDA